MSSGVIHQSPHSPSRKFQIPSLAVIRASVTLFLGTLPRRGRPDLAECGSADSCRPGVRSCGAHLLDGAGGRPEAWVCLNSRLRVAHRHRRRRSHRRGVAQSRPSQRQPGCRGPGVPRHVSGRRCVHDEGCTARPNAVARAGRGDRALAIGARQRNCERRVPAERRSLSRFSKVTPMKSRIAPPMTAHTHHWVSW